MFNNENYKQFMLNAYQEHLKGKSWAEIGADFYALTGKSVTNDAIRKRVKRVSNLQNKTFNNSKTSEFYNASFEQYNPDGSVEATKEILDDLSQFKGNREKILNYLGYSFDEWELVSWRISRWDGGVNGTPKFALQYKIKPRLDILPSDIIKAVKNALNEEINPIYLNNVYGKTNKNSLLMEIPPVELHLGKIADKIQTGEEYNFEIAKERFYSIFEKILSEQQQMNCERCLLVIGSDFFNSESDSCTSVHKVPQQNNCGYIKMFSEGIRMYKDALIALRENFNKVDVMLCAGNHARAMETFLFMALEQAFIGDNIVHFISNYKQTQCYVYGENAIFYNHGDAKLQQIMKSIPAEFAKQWGSHKYRELHLGHLHKEVTVDDEGGMITRRVGSPCSTDAWHAENRYVGAIKKHEIFIWNKTNGLDKLIYIPIK